MRQLSPVGLPEPDRDRARFDVGNLGTEEVRNYYASFDRRELQRLLTPEGPLEFDMTTRLLQPHLPADGRILDIGGSLGRYEPG